MSSRTARRSRCPRRLAFAAAAFATTAAATALAQEEPDPPFFSTRVGGRLERIVVAPDGDLVVAGWAWDTDLSLAHDDPGVLSHDGPPGWFLVARLARDGRPEWTTFVPGLQQYWDPTVRGLAVGPDDSVWVAGYGAVSETPGLVRGRVGGEDGVVLRLSPDGTLLFATHVGGRHHDRIADLAILPDGDAVVVGTTSSPDFLALPPSADTGLFRQDAFVARIRSDGSDLVWGTRYGTLQGTSEFTGAAVAVDPADGTVLATVVGDEADTFEPLGVLRAIPGEPAAPDVLPARVAAVFRLDASGEWRAGARFRVPVSTHHWDEELLRRSPLAIDADGSVLVGIPSRVLRLPGHLTFVADASKSAWRGVPTGRLSPLPGGGVAVAEFHSLGGRVSRLDADLDAPKGGAGSPDALSLGFVPADIALDGKGVLHVVGTGPGVSFGTEGETTGPTGGFVARLPLGGGRPPSGLRVRPLSGGGASLRWSADGDAAVRHEVERTSEDAAPEIVGQAGDADTSLRVLDLLPGARHDLRVVAVFADGTRAAGPLREVVTLPAAPGGVSARRVAGSQVEVAWDDPNGDAVRWQVQRRIGGGPWRATRLAPGSSSLRPVRRLDADSNPHTDLVPDVAAPIRWRVRAVQPGRRTRWVESAELRAAPALRVVPKSGAFGNIGFAPTMFLASGTVAARDGTTPLAFSPATEDLRLLFGAAELPLEFVIEAGDPGWAPPANGVLRWSAGETLTGWDSTSEIVLDLAAGTFDVSLRWPYARPGAASGSVVVNFTLGGRSGGHVGTWRRTSLTPTLVRLGAPGRRGGRR